jgi:hypothetical protein
MSIATVVTRGFGSFGSIPFVVTRGYGQDGTSPEPPIAEPEGHGARQGTSARYERWLERKNRELRERRLELQREKVERVVERLDQAKASPRPAAALQAAAEIADGIEFEQAAEALGAMIRAASKSIDTRGEKIVAAIAEAHRIQEQIRQEEDDEDIVLLLANYH